MYSGQGGGRGGDRGGGMGGGQGGGRGGGKGGGRGRTGGSGMPGQGAGVGGKCVCPQCGYSESHERGNPCDRKNCPRCGTIMTRG